MASPATSSTSACRTGPQPFDNLKIRQAIGYALNKQSYIDAFYAGLANVADNFMPPATQDYKALGLPTYDPEKAKALIAESGVSADKLAIDFYYPSDVARPYMPDPKGEAEAIATDLEAVGFKINFKTEGWRTGYLSDSATGKFPMFLLGWTCDWAGPDNFLITDLFYFNSDGTPNPQFSYGAALTSRPRSTPPSRRRTTPTRRPRGSTAQDILGA